MNRLTTNQVTNYLEQPQSGGGEGSFPVIRQRHLGLMTTHARLLPPPPASPQPPTTHSHQQEKKKKLHTKEEVEGGQVSGCE